MEESCAKKTTIKSVFVSGEMVTINGKFYTRMYSDEELEDRKRNPATKISAKEMDRLMDETMKEMFPESHKELYPQHYR